MLLPTFVLRAISLVGPLLNARDLQWATSTQYAQQTGGGGWADSAPAGYTSPAPLTTTVYAAGGEQPAPTTAGYPQYVSGPPPTPGHGPWSPVVVGGTATVALSPDKTVVVENPALTVTPIDNPAAWTSVPDGWYATSYQECQKQSCEWHVVVRQWNSAAGRTLLAEKGLRVGALIAAMAGWMING